MSDQNIVVTGNAVVLWDSITKPDSTEGGGYSWGLKLALDARDPSFMQLDNIVKHELSAGMFRGLLPPGGNMPMRDVGIDEYESKLNGYAQFSVKTTRGAPQVFDINGQLLDPMQYGQMFYPGAIVQVIVHAYSYNNKQKGIALGVDGIKIVDATAPRLPVGSNVDAAKMFGFANIQKSISKMTSAPVTNTSTSHQMTDLATFTYEQYKDSKWTDEALIQSGFMLEHAPVVTAPPPPNAIAPPPPVSSAPPPPPQGPQMTNSATNTYEEYKKSGWNDQDLISNGLMID